MEPPFQRRYRKQVLLKCQSLEATAHQMAQQIKACERAMASIERRLGRRHVTCKKCGEVFNIRKNTIRLPQPGNPIRYAVAVCPKCNQNN